MAKQVSIAKEFTKGLWEQNPVFRQVLGMCPVLAVTSKLESGIGMAVATTFVLVLSSFLISLMRKMIPPQVRIASFIVVIATFVTIVDYVLQAQFPALSASLGMFIPLIVVNCLILGRQEAFASKNNPLRAATDALGMGIGFLIALSMLSAVREVLGFGTLLGIRVMPDSFVNWNLMTQAPGAYITLGLMLAAIIYFEQKKKLKLHNVALAVHNKETLELKTKMLDFKEEKERAKAEAKAKKAAIMKAKKEADAKKKAEEENNKSEEK